MLDVVIPVYNEERDLGPCVRRLHAYLAAHLPYPFRITIADNASTDDTPLVARQLADEFAHVVHLRLEAKGRGRRCGRPGPVRTRRCSPTWTWTCRPTWPRCCRWWRR